MNLALQSMRNGFARNACKTFRPRLERVIATKGDVIEYFDVFNSWYIIMSQKVYNITVNDVAASV